MKKGNKIVKKKDRTNFDSPWKEVLDAFFKDFILFCFPKIAKDIDWKKGNTFMDKELHSIKKDSAKGQRTVDKLVKVFKHSGKEMCVLIHLEMQSQKNQDFEERMYTYQYRLFDRYHVPVASLAILIDSNKNWAPNKYQSALWGTKLTFEYEVLKILSYQNKQAQLAQSTNPFATVILAQLEAMALKKEGDSKQHLASKIQLTRMLYEKGWNREYVCNLYRFIDWIIQLPKDLVVEYDNAIHQIEEGKKMTYVTSIERLGIERGKAIGEARGKAIGEAIGEARGKAEIIQNLYRSIKDPQKVAKLCRLSLKKVNKILGQDNQK